MMFENQMENQMLGAISHIKNVSKKSPTAEKFFTHVSKTSASNINLTFVNENNLLPKIKLMIISKLLWNPKTETLINPLMKYRLMISWRP